VVQLGLLLTEVLHVFGQGFVGFLKLGRTRRETFRGLRM
jgi:hypothetical protein